jgi:alkaline phosphatase
VSKGARDFVPYAAASSLHERQLTNELDARGYTFAGRDHDFETLTEKVTATAMKDGKAYGVLAAIGGSWVFSVTRDQIQEAMRLHR